MRDLNNREKIAISLAESIRGGLIRQYGKVPSANIFANHFNIRAYGTKTITRETARKWLLGLAVPDVDKLVVLVEWLNIDVLSLFGQTSQFKNGENGVSSINGASNINNVKLSSHNSLTPNYASRDIEESIHACFKELNENAQHALLIAAWTLKQLEHHDDASQFCQQLMSSELTTCSICQQKAFAAKETA